MSENNTQYRKYILFFLFIWMLANFFPGSYNVDTWYQYFEMEKSDYDDWHSPWMAYLWKILYLGSDRFFSMYLFQMTWYFVFYYYLLKLVNTKLILVLGLFSSILFIFMPQYIMKDVHLALAWGSAALLILYDNFSASKYRKYLAMVLMVYGLFIRPNTLPALLPLLYIYIECYFPQHWNVLRKSLLTVFFGITFFASYYILTYYVFETRRAYPEYKLKLMDVIGISKLSGEELLPGCITSYEKYDRNGILTLYTPATIDHIYWPYDGIERLPMPSKELDQCLQEAWKKAILKHPYLYIKNRFTGFLYYLRIIKRVEPDLYWNITVSVVKNNYIPIDDHHTPLTEKLIGYWKKLDKFCFYDPWLWMTLNAVFFILFLLKYIKRKIYYYKTLAAIQLSGVLFTLGMLPVFQIDLDFRYTYWNVIVFLIGAIFYFGGIQSEEEHSF